jgi:MSHA biogenesis protein MshJ
MEVIRRWVSKLNAVSIRERLFVFIAVLGILVYVWYALLMHPLAKHKAQLQAQINDKQIQITKLEKLINDVERGKKIIPGAEQRSRIASLKFDIDKLDDRLKHMTGGLIDPTQMTKVLQGLLVHQTALTLLSMESLGAKPLIDSSDKSKANGKQNPTAPSPDAAVAQVYMHGVRIKFKGGYLDTLDYLKALERLPWHFFWGDFDYDVKHYPDAEGTLDVYTLSLKEGWLGV